MGFELRASEFTLLTTQFTGKTDRKRHLVRGQQAQHQPLPTSYVLRSRRPEGLRDPTKSHCAPARWFLQGTQP